MTDGFTDAANRHTKVQETLTHKLRMSIPESLHEAVSNGMVFTQTDDMQYFIMDDSQTFGDSDPPCKACVENFDLGGIWLQPVYLDRINFQCKLYGAIAYNEDTWIEEDENAGTAWNVAIPFDVPAVTPPGTYYITATAYDDEDTVLFQIITDFKF